MKQATFLKRIIILDMANKRKKDTLCEGNLVFFICFLPFFHKRYQAEDHRQDLEKSYEKHIPEELRGQGNENFLMAFVVFWFW